MIHILPCTCDECFLMHFFDNVVGWFCNCSFPLEGLENFVH